MHIYIYIYVCVCVRGCVCLCVLGYVRSLKVHLQDGCISCYISGELTCLHYID